MSTPIYLDHNASTPIAPEVAEAMAPYATRHFGNPRTRHWAGRPAGEAVARARQQVADAVGCEPDEIVFTSGASEANNYAIKGLYFANRQRGDHFVASAIEHPCVKESLAFLAGTFGVKTTYVAVDRFGRVDPAVVEAAITPRTLAVCVMHANNEVGTIQPIAEIAGLARKHGVTMHCDAAQTLGKIPVHAGEMGVDLLSIAGHKLYAPKGVGALVVRKTAPPLAPLIHGAGQESGRRGGTENVEYIVGLGAACGLFAKSGAAERIHELRDYFWRRLQAEFGERVRLNGHEQHRLPNTLNVGFRGATATDLLDRLDGIAASPGAACHYGDTRLSPTLSAMGVDPEYGRGSIRWSLGRSTTQSEIDEVVKRLSAALSS